MPENTVKVDRSTEWGNPFPIRRATDERGKTVFVVEGASRSASFGAEAEARAASVEAFRGWLAQPSQREWRHRAVSALAGKNLACWCPLDGPCHADILLDLVNPTGGGERA